jgi:hypothetical protein
MLYLHKKRKIIEGKLMIWLEMIRTQAALGKEATVESELKALSQNALKNPDQSGLTEIIIYKHASVSGYFAICLVWETEHAQAIGSVTGLNVSQTLKNLGLVDHSVWIQRE